MTIFKKDDSSVSKTKQVLTNVNNGGMDKGRPSTMSSAIVVMLVLASTGKLRRNDSSRSSRLSEMLISNDGTRASNLCLLSKYNLLDFWEVNHSVTPIKICGKSLTPGHKKRNENEKCFNFSFDFLHSFF